MSSWIASPVAFCVGLMFAFGPATSQAAAGEPLNFTTDILPVLSKYGCNNGSCHGRAIGQNGFKLSLFGFDPEYDFAAIVHEGHGRRISPAAPTDSLLLRKATAQVAHGGGVRFASDSDAYKLLRRWIEEGTAWGRDSDPHEMKLEITPAERVVVGKRSVQLRVVVHYSDNSMRDVTRLARYASQQPDRFAVSDEGLVQASGSLGEGHVIVKYQTLVATTLLMSQSGPALPDEAYAAFKPKNFIDELVLAKWRKLHIAPSPAANDAEFIRRAFLGAMGTLPTPKEVRDFLDDESADKREKLVDHVLDREEYVDLWAHRMGDLLRNHVGDSNAKPQTVAFAKWIRESVAKNKPYDQFVREVLTVSGKGSDNPPSEWYRWAGTDENRVEDTAQAFLGMRVSCANCHDHPFENIRQRDYWQFAAIFSRIKITGGGISGISDIKATDMGDVKHPRTEKLLAPKPFGGPEFTHVKGQDTRVKLMDWMVAPDNPYFARAIVNRVWGHYMGVGLVDPVDDMRVSNPPSNPELLDALARDFVEHEFDLKHLMKTILMAQVYGLSSNPTDSNRADTRNYAKYYPRRLSPHVLLDAVSGATGVPTTFEGYPGAKKAIQLPNEMSKSDFLTIFGRSQRGTACECETRLTPNLPQVMFLLNSDEIQKKLTDKKGVVATLVESKKPVPEVVEELFLRTFSRLPRPEELKTAIASIEDASKRNEAIEDLLWALLNSKEFLFDR